MIKEQIMISNNNSPKIIIVSDIHLGALKARLDLFYLFLEKIDNGGFGNDLQALIIVGDFFDLCTDTPDSLFNTPETIKIIKKLSKIRDKVDIVFILGNHEIPVTGNFNRKFRKRKKKFLKKLSIGEIDDLIENNLVCQYAILRTYQGKTTILLYDSIKQIHNKYIEKIEIKGMRLEDGFQSFITHGYQYDSGTSRFFAGILWSLLINSESMIIKDIFNYLWNGLIKEDKSVKGSKYKQMLKDLPQLKNQEPEIIQDQFSRYNSLNFYYIKFFMKLLEKWEHERRYE
ncbi:MAG: metallophosphoesterase, partial [Candidatus Hermodarchaeota archaeon]